MQLENRQITELASPFAKMVNSLEEFYKNPENKKKYKEWYLKKYGCEPKEV